MIISEQGLLEKQENAKDTYPDKVVKCKLKTRTIGLKRRQKRKSTRKYKCPNCASIHDSIALLNAHYKSSHPPVKCEECSLFFNTPSTRSRHMYKHINVDHSCTKCDKKFPFESDLSLHMNKHRTVKSFKCKSPGCKKSYYSKGELDKHTETHKNIDWNCELCTYSSKDKRNLKAHMRVHSNLKPYMCEKCTKLFCYDTQLRRHWMLPCDKEEKASVKNADSDRIKPKRSRSPSF